MSLHDAIMNLPCAETEYLSAMSRPVYEEGQRAALRAAAELALAADKKMAEQTLTLAHMAGHVADLTLIVDQQTAEIAELRAALQAIDHHCPKYSGDFADGETMSLYDFGGNGDDLAWESRARAIGKVGDIARAALEPKP